MPVAGQETQVGRQLGFRSSSAHSGANDSRRVVGNTETITLATKNLALPAASNRIVPVKSDYR